MKLITLLTELNNESNLSVICNRFIELEKSSNNTSNYIWANATFNVSKKVLKQIKLNRPISEVDSYHLINADRFLDLLISDKLKINILCSKYDCQVGDENFPNYFLDVKSAASKKFTGTASIRIVILNSNSNNLIITEMTKIGFEVYREFKDSNCIEFRKKYR
jgi:hypothetical protein